MQNTQNERNDLKKRFPGVVDPVSHIDIPFGSSKKATYPLGGLKRRAKTPTTFPATAPIRWAAYKSNGGAAESG
jgi:hypothetical protein